MKYIVSRIQGSGKNANKVGLSEKDVYADGYIAETTYDAVPYSIITFYNKTERWFRDPTFSDVATFHVTGDYVVESE